ncbi:enkurin [Kryptolebias marmoratus]|uniref:Enkurin, TRPC channel interacting protein n=1 Tax=Kryptolebias marmoratus TaxID=37003 RepID=A0A3Q3B7X7_KRYMA|nr:enkurin [Kryptolebias marmoratus]
MSELFYPQQSVYDHLIPNEDEVKKPPRYVSKFRQAVILENKSNRDSKRTMGPAKVDAPSPDKYLKKHSKEPKLSEKTECLKDTCSTCACTVRKPPIPARTDVPLMGIHTKRDFLKTTEVVPMKPKPTSVVNNVGDKQLLENSGLVPKYILKKDYGEVPAYIQQRRKVEQRAQEEYERFVGEQKEQVAMQRLSDKERQAVMQGLKKKWDEVNGVYQKLPLIIDTLSKKTHKIQLEEELSQLEKDIRLFERFTTIYISKN